MTYQALAPFKYHGQNVNTITGGQAVSDCPFCNKKGHLYISAEDGLWDCKSCGESGNTYTFLRKLLEQYQEDTTDKHLAELAKMRKLPAKDAVPFFRECGIAYTGDGYLIPTTGKNKSKAVLNLHYYHHSKKERKYVLHSTAGMPGKLYYPTYRPDTHPSDDPVLADAPMFLCEGHWDTLALELFRRKHGINALVAGVPGATALKDSWLPHFENRRLINLLYDHDPSGVTNQDKKALKLREANSATTINLTNWPAKLPKGYDVNDYVAQNWKSPKGWVNLEKLLVPHTSRSYSRTRKGPPPTFKTLVKKFKQHYYLDRQMMDTWAICLATVISDKVKGEPIWVYVVGPPSSGKTVMLRSMENSSRCVFQSVLSPTSFISCYKDKDANSEGDPSLIRKVKGKTLVIKDFTAILDMPLAMQAELNGLLRDAYDGYISKPCGNNVTREYKDCQFSLLAGVTHVIHGSVKGSLGERFLRAEFLSRSHDDTAQLEKAVLASTDKTYVDTELKVISELREVVADFLDNSLPKTLPTLPAWVKQRIVPLVKIIAHIRTDVPKDYKGNPIYRPQVEIGSRLVKQLLHLSQCLAAVLGKKAVDLEVYNIIQRIAFDSVTGWTSDIFLLLAKNPNKRYTVDSIANDLEVSNSVVYGRLQDMDMVGMVAYEKLQEKSTRRGPKRHGYTLSPKLRQLWVAAKL